MILNNWADVVDDCLTREEKEILSVKCGQVTITPKDQFLLEFNKPHIKPKAQTKEEFCQRFAVILEENRHLINAIKDIVQKRDRLLDLDAYKVKSESLATSDETKKGSSVHLQTSDAKKNSYILEVSQTESDRKSLTKTNSGSSFTNKLRDVETAWSTKNVIEGKAIQNKKTITKTDEFQFDAVDQKQDAPTTPTIVDSKSDISYQDFQLSNVGDHGVNYSSSQDENLTKWNTKTTANHDWSRDQSTSGEQNVNRAAWIEKDALLDAWTLEIPKLRQKFWNKFIKLFDYGYIY